MQAQVCSNCSATTTQIALQLSFGVFMEMSACVLDFYIVLCTYKKIALVLSGFERRQIHVGKDNNSHYRIGSASLSQLVVIYIYSRQQNLLRLVTGADDLDDCIFLCFNFEVNHIFTD